jgi:hypothetical protein
LVWLADELVAKQAIDRQDGRTQGGLDEHVVFLQEIVCNPASEGFVAMQQVHWVIAFLCAYSHRQ